MFPCLANLSNKTVILRCFSSLQILLLSFIPIYEVKVIKKKISFSSLFSSSPIDKNSSSRYQNETKKKHAFCCHHEIFKNKLVVVIITNTNTHSKKNKWNVSAFPLWSWMSQFGYIIYFFYLYFYLSPFYILFFSINLQYFGLFPFICCPILFSFAFIHCFSLEFFYQFFIIATTSSLVQFYFISFYHIFTKHTTNAIRLTQTKKKNK